jgi:hypothetical protein
MVPKQVEVCPKCNGQLLHFDRSENGSPWIRFLVWFFFFCFCVFFLPFWKLICVLLMEIQCGKIMKRVTNELLLVSLLLVFYQIFLSLFVFFFYSYFVPLLYYGSHWHCRRVLRASGKVNILERTVSFLSMIATCSSPSLSSLL